MDEKLEGRVIAALEEQVVALKRENASLENAALKPVIEMPRRRLGSSGLMVPALALGCFSFGGDKKMGGHISENFSALHEGVWGDQSDEDTFSAVKAALDNGINFFDNAEMYGDGYAEEVLGRALKASGYKRDEYIIATKVSESYLSAALVREHLEGSLLRLQTDFIDLYQIHWHSRAAQKSEHYPERPLEQEVPLEETMKALGELQKEGKIRHIGVCNFGCEDIRDVLATGVPIVSNQICYSLLWRGVEEGLVDLCMANDIAILPWGPLGQGLLAGKFATADDVPPGRARTRLFSKHRAQQRHGEDGEETKTFAAIEEIRGISAETGEPMANVSLSWLMARRGVVSVLMGARNISQVERNMGAIAVELPPGVVRALDSATDELKQALGSHLDPYEPAEQTRIK
jgi:aryl-alcohol dehydrogenase-like predicted oxidoreductase